MSFLITAIGVLLMLLFLAIFVVSLISLFKPIRKLGFESRRTALKWTVLALVGFSVTPTLIDGLTGVGTGSPPAAAKGDQVAAPAPATPSTPLRSTLPATPAVEPVADRSIQTEPADASWHPRTDEVLIRSAAMLLSGSMTLQSANRVFELADARAAEMRASGDTGFNSPFCDMVRTVAQQSWTTIPQDLREP